ncbi:ABC transporter substrate-binding protein [Heyndrickxia shackletonii]|uniref:ABC transporter substrate-binding protein n=1 Tax=Heyndrickxia shackletonii TaxID=157838 RepID=A0A0Q3WUZ6_9BACI|nr:peptide ABC transporter substrate-binding protein [Heyndrickxia shackletonii]KQL52915.1 ABC transporter substrate-binding protein [Heyndrickxia shackletonii]MBB2481401.1 peptide ABC transporter substrate-binding protein [Bacillus sp. APMAM]NEY98904.1 peptide ABC transporter substrate-binding protein [Heyndrickxia shackletonii]RTZ55263.1 peptide ABC transporter substrate-binding protein [Bacillus sp. SAJ1]
MKKWLIMLVAMLALSSVLAGCGGDKATSGNSKDVKQEMTVGMTAEPPALDPALATDTTSGWVLNHTFEGLYTKDKKGEIVPGLAKDTKVSDDGKTYTFTIRDDAKWSDGTPVTAQDFEYSWKRVLNPETGSSFAFYLYYIKGAEAYNKGKGSADQVGVKAVDDHTLQVELNAPLAYFNKLLAMYTFYPVKKDLVEKNKNWAADAKNYVSNGAFKMTDWKHNSQVVIEKNDKYYGQKDVSLKKITFKIVPDATTYYQMYKTGELDFIMTLPSDALEAEKNNKEFKEVPYFGTYMIMFNVNKEPFTNAKIRRAFAMSIDRKTLTDNVTKAGEIPAYGMVPPGVKTPNGGDFREEGGNYFKEDAAEAKKLLQEGMKEEGWSTLPNVTLLYNTAENNKKIAEAVQEMVKKNLGVDIKVNNQEWKTYLDTTHQQNFQMARMGWIGSFVDPVIMLDYYLGDSPNNRTGWVNKKYDDIMAKSKVEQDETKRFELLHQAEDVLMQDMPFMPVYFYTNTFLVSSKFSNIAYYLESSPSFKWAKKTSN